MNGDREFDNLSPATQAAGATVEKNGGGSTLKKRKPRKNGNDSTPVATPVSRGTNGTNGDTPATQSSKRKKKRRAKALDMNLDEDETNGNPLEGPSAFAELQKQLQSDATKADVELAVAEQEKEEEAEENTEVSKGISVTQPQVMLPILVAIPVIAVIIIASMFLSDAYSLHRRAAATTSGQLLSWINKFQDVLELEAIAAGQLQLFETVVAAGRTTSVSPPMDRQVYWDARYAYEAAIKKTDAASSALLKHYVPLENAIRDISGGFTLSPGAVSFAGIERLRDKVLSGSYLSSTVAEYTEMRVKLAVFASRFHLRAIAITDSDLLTIRRVCTVQQKSLLPLLRRAIYGTSGSTTLLIATESRLRLVWKLMGTIDACLDAVSAGTAASVSEDAVLAIPETLLADVKTLVESASVNLATVSAGVAWNVSSGADLRALQRQYASGRSALIATKQSEVESTNAGFFTAQYALVVVLITIACVGFVYNASTALHFVFNVRQHHQALREVRSLERAMRRMLAFTDRLGALEVAWAQTFTKRVTNKGSKIKSQPEEMALYHAASNLKDIAMYLPPIVTNPPKTVDAKHLSKGLLLRHHLQPMRSIVAIRSSLGQFHQSFGNAGTKQKAMQHVVVRFLTLLQELGSKAAPTSFLNIVGDHSVLWINVLESIEYPCVAAMSVVNGLHKELRGGSYAPPHICVCSGDGLIGNVGTIQNDKASLGSGLTTFSVFGPVADELRLLDGVCSLHESDFVANNEFTCRFRAEKRLIKDDAFADDPDAVKAEIEFKPLEFLRMAPFLRSEESRRKSRMAPGGEPGSPGADGVATSQTYNFDEAIPTKDYTTTLADGSKLAPCYSIVHANRGEEAATGDWDRFFGTLFSVMTNNNNTNVSTCKTYLEDYISHHGEGATTQRLSRVLSEAIRQDRLGADIADVKRDLLKLGLA